MADVHRSGYRAKSTPIKITSHDSVGHGKHIMEQKVPAALLDVHYPPSTCSEDDWMPFEYLELRDDVKEELRKLQVFPSRHLSAPDGTLILLGKNWDPTGTVFTSSKGHVSNTKTSQYKLPKRPCNICGLRTHWQKDCPDRFDKLESPLLQKFFKFEWQARRSAPVDTSIDKPNTAASSVMWSPGSFGDGSIQKVKNATYYASVTDRFLHKIADYQKSGRNIRDSMESGEDGEFTFAES
ncbi:hypothetical protein HK405_012635 [Cladochytrium tenue]|nr:hypothetical protein HK405_012635 [Cladochytrium tenue]